MSRPAHVRCENCCYYHPKTLDDEPLTRGVCRIGPISYAKDQDQWCGEFRAEWPEAGYFVHDMREAYRHPLDMVTGTLPDDDVEVAEDKPST